jgi:hypothetical protein
MAKLEVVIRNSEPKREHVYPHTWLLYKAEHRAIKLVVTRTIRSTPHVKARSEATVA